MLALRESITKSLIIGICGSDEWQNRSINVTAKRLGYYAIFATVGREALSAGPNKMASPLGPLQKDLQVIDGATEAVLSLGDVISRLRATRFEKTEHPLNDGAVRIGRPRRFC
jgi:hypothetical protein